MSQLSCHVLDNTNGVPASDITVKVFRLGSFECLAEGITGADGRVDFGDTHFAAGNYTLRFLVAPYCEAQFGQVFFPMIDIHFTITDKRHYHIPLLLSPFAFSSYRGS